MNEEPEKPDNSLRVNRASFDQSLDEFSKTEFRARSVQPNSTSEINLGDEEKPSEQTTNSATALPKSIPTDKPDATVSNPDPSPDSSPDSKLLKKIDQLSRQCEVDQKEIEKLTLESAAAQSNSKNMDRAVEEIQQKESEIVALQASIEQLNTDAQTLADELKQSQTLHATADSSREKLAHSLPKKEGEITELTEKLESASRTVGLLENELAESQRAQSNLRDITLSENTKEIESLNSQLQKQTEQNTSIANELESSITEKKSLESEIAASLLSHSQQIETEVTNKKTEIESLDSQLQERTEQNANIASELEASSATIESLEKQLADATASQSQFRAMKKQNRSLSKELRSTRSKLAAITDSNLETEPEGEMDPVFMARCRKRMKSEYKKRKVAQQQLSEAEEQRNKVASALQQARIELQSLRQ